MTNPITYVTAPQVRARLGGVSDMALWRWLQDEKLAFPKPIYINRRRYFDEAEVIAWIAGRSRGAAA